VDGDRPEGARDKGMLVPTMLKWIVDSPDFHAYDLSSLSIVTYGPPHALRGNQEGDRDDARGPVHQRLRPDGECLYSHDVGPEDHRITGTEEEKALKWKRLQSSIGRPLPDVQIRIVDDEGTSWVPAGGRDPREGSRIMKGYWATSRRRPRR